MPYRPGLPLDEVIKRVKPASRPESASVLWEVVADSAVCDLDADTDGVQACWNTFPMRGTYAEGVAWVVGTLADAVAYAHARGVQHRDIKPANVLLTLHNGPQLLDFNLAHDPHAAEQAAAALRGGTLPYMAPEQLEAFLNPERWSSVGFGADLYSLGLVMHELLTGLAPAVPDPAVPLTRAIQSLLDRRTDLSFHPRRLNPAIPHALEAIILRCLAYAAADRYAGVDQLAEDLRLFQAGKPLRYAVNPSLSERLRNWGRRNRVALAASVVLGAVGSYMTLDRLTPIERRSDFRAAMAAVDERPDPKALVQLEPLAKAYPDSPLVQLYFSGVQASTLHLKEAAVLYEKATRMADAEAVFGAWAREHPGVVTQLESVGKNLFDAKIGTTSEFDPRYHELGHKAVMAALHLGSTDEGCQVRTAVYDQGQGNYAAALEKATAVIDQIERITDNDDRKARLNCNNCYRVRARIWLQSGDQALSTGSAESLERARSCIENGLADVSRAETVCARDDKKRLDACGEYRACAELGLSKLAILEDQYDEARQHHREVHRLIDELRPRLWRMSSFLNLELQLDELDEVIQSLAGLTPSTLR
jgi:hypothetical protein